MYTRQANDVVTLWYLQISMYDPPLVIVRIVRVRVGWQRRCETSTSSIYSVCAIDMYL